ncbi:MAG: aldo/keto reductase [Jatrophihabitans sp.]
MPTTDLNLALGAMLFGTTVDEPRAFALLDHYIDAGGSWIDTANAYAFWVSAEGDGGQSESLIGRWLAARPGVRERLRVSTKMGAYPISPGSYPASVEGLTAPAITKAALGSLQRMGIDTIDLYWAHMDDRSTDQSETVDAFGRLLEEGAIRRFGASNWALWRVERARGIALAAGGAPPSALQSRYSYLQPRPLARDHLHDHRFGWITDETLDYARANPTLRCGRTARSCPGPTTGPSGPCRRASSIPGRNVDSQYWTTSPVNSA